VTLFTWWLSTECLLIQPNNSHLTTPKTNKPGKKIALQPNHYLSWIILKTNCFLLSSKTTRIKVVICDTVRRMSWLAQTNKQTNDVFTIMFGVHFQSEKREPIKMRWPHPIGQTIYPPCLTWRERKTKEKEERRKGNNIDSQKAATEKCKLVKWQDIIHFYSINKNENISCKKSSFPISSQL
jgi:hypothetical protein